MDKGRGGEESREQREKKRVEEKVDKGRGGGIQRIEREKECFSGLLLQT